MSGIVSRDWKQISKTIYGHEGDIKSFHKKAGEQRPLYIWYNNNTYCATIDHYSSLQYTRIFLLYYKTS